MNIKVGQWVRTKTTLFKAKSIRVNGFINNQEEKGFGAWPEDVIATADTPQELLQPGDFIIYQQIGARLNHVRKNEIVFQQFYKSIVIKKENYNMITAIYTPNADKTQYTLQWSVNK